MTDTTPVGRTSVLTIQAVALIAAVLAATALGGRRALSLAATPPQPSTLAVGALAVLDEEDEPPVRRPFAWPMRGIAHR